MTSMFDLKPAFCFLLRGVSPVLKARGITALQVKFSSLVMSIAVGLVVARFAFSGPWLVLLPIWLLLRVALSALEEMMAEGAGARTPAAAMAYELCDLFSDVALYFPLAVVIPWAEWPVVFFVLSILLVELSTYLGQALGARRHVEGPMTQNGRALFVSAIAIIAVVKPLTVLRWGMFFWVATFLLLLTCAVRLTAALKDLKK